MELLTKKIEERLQARKSCRIFSRDLNRVWPVTSEERQARDQRIDQSRQYADSHGWSVLVYDPGLHAVFWRKETSPTR